MPTPSVGSGISAPDGASAFTDYLTKSLVPRFRAAALKPGLSELERSYLSGKADGTVAQAKIVGRNPSWMTRFGTKMRVEQVVMGTEEQQIAISVLFGSSPKTKITQYWQGYEDAIQETIVSMNTWPGTGGEVKGTAVEYAIVIPRGPNAYQYIAESAPSIVPARSSAAMQTSKKSVASASSMPRGAQ